MRKLVAVVVDTEANTFKFCELSEKGNEFMNSDEDDGGYWTQYSSELSLDRMVDILKGL